MSRSSVLPGPPALVTLPGSIIASDTEFDLFRQLLYRHAGIDLGPHKRQFLQARLARRLRALGLPGFGPYYRLLTREDGAGEEMTRFINAMTTNKTDFFRESHHFIHLAETWLPGIRQRAGRSGDRSIRIWSAGCSTGEEPYTTSMVLRDGLAGFAGWDVRILASDIDTDVLERAAQGCYTLPQTSAIPPRALVRHFLLGQGDHAGLVCVRPEVRAPITFRRINLLDEAWPIRTRFDVIFCRNVLIYFDRAAQRRIIERFAALLKPEGLLFLGHSESLHGLVSDFEPLGNTIYRLVPPSPGGGPAIVWAGDPSDASCSTAGRPMDGG